MARTLEKLRAQYNSVSHGQSLRGGGPGRGPGPGPRAKGKPKDIKKTVAFATVFLCLMFSKNQPEYK